MKSYIFHGRMLAAATVGLVAAATIGTHISASAAAQAYSLASVGAYGGEPSIQSDGNGVLYDTTPSGGTIVYRSLDGGNTWVKRTTADPNSGDTCITTDQSNAVYECNLAGSDTAPLQADVFKSTDQGATWTKGANTVSGNGDTCGGSCSAFGVDRQWTTAWIPAGKATKDAHVVLMYHDFYGPSQIWVNISTDGGAHFGASKPVLANPAATPGSVLGSGTGNLFSMCNTIPTGISTVKSGAHAGRVYVSWIAADVVQNTTGCNVTQFQAFHTLWVAWSDDGGNTWTPQLAFDGGLGHDASSPFASFTLDDQGNPYIGFTDNLNANPATCAAESTSGTGLQTDTTCEYDMYVVWSPDGGMTWDGGGGTVPGSATAAYRVNPANEKGTHFFPAIAAGDPGQVDVAYLRTPTILPTDPAGKADPGGCGGPPPSSYPPACSWNLFAGQSLNLTQTPGHETWATVQLTTTAMHVGDVCNLGIACVPGKSNRNLLDFISETVDPTTGCAHIAYADDNTVNKLRVANQTAGCLTILGTPIPEAPLVALFLPAGLAAVWMGRRIRRGRRARAAA